MDTGVSTQQYVQSVELCFADKIAGMGVDRDDFGGELAGLASALEELKRPDAELAAVLNSPQADLDPANLKAIAEDWRGRFTRVVVFGIGGSAMGARAVLALRWDLPPAISASVFAGLARELRPGLPVGEALRSALTDLSGDPSLGSAWAWIALHGSTR